MTLLGHSKETEFTIAVFHLPFLSLHDHLGLLYNIIISVSLYVLIWIFLILHTYVAVMNNKLPSWMVIK